MRCSLIWSPTLQRVSWSMRCGPQRMILWNLPLHWRASKVAEDGFNEFYPTEASVQKAVLTLFWKPVEE